MINFTDELKLLFRQRLVLPLIKYRDCSGISEGQGQHLISYITSSYGHQDTHQLGFQSES